MTMEGYFELLDQAYNSIWNDANIYEQKIKDIILNTAKELKVKKDVRVAAVHLTQDSPGIFLLSKGKLHLN